MELLDFEWARCLDGYRLQKRKPLGAKAEAKARVYRMVNLDPHPNSDYITENSTRFEWYRPLNNVLFKTFATWDDTPEGMIRFCDCYGQLLGAPGGRQIAQVEWMLEERKALSISLMLLETGNPSELIKRLHPRWAAGCAFTLRQSSDGALRPTLIPNSLIQAIWLQLALYAASGTKLLSCERCGKPFQVGSGTKRRNTAKYCSNACKVAAYKERREA